MGKTTGIAWCDHTFNLVWGCTKVSRGCARCYAENVSKRYGNDVWGPNKERRTFGDSHWNEPLKWHKEAVKVNKRQRVFCGSMCDVFEDHPTTKRELLKLWPLIRATPMFDWQLLTKRPERIKASLPDDWGEGYPNVWMGTSTEDQETLEYRVPFLSDVPASIRFLSAEPLIGAIDLTRVIPHYNVDWVIFGGESHQDYKVARPMNIEWVRQGIKDCREFNVAPFVKQLGSRLAKEMNLRHKKGEDPEEWPADIKIQEFPYKVNTWLN